MATCDHTSYSFFSFMKHSEAPVGGCPWMQPPSLPGILKPSLEMRTDKLTHEICCCCCCPSVPPLHGRGYSAGVANEQNGYLSPPRRLCFHQRQFVGLQDFAIKNYSNRFAQKYGERWHMGHRRNRGGNPDYVMVGLL